MKGSWYKSVKHIQKIAYHVPKIVVNTENFIFLPYSINNG